MVRNKKKSKDESFHHNRSVAPPPSLIPQSPATVTTDDTAHSSFPYSAETRSLSLFISCRKKKLSKKLLYI